MLRYLLGALVAVGLALGTAIMLVNFALEQAHAEPTGRSDKIRTEYMPCSVEDGRNCVWDALHQGNGQGNSFFVGRQGKVWVLPHHIAHSLLHLTSAHGPYFACETPVTSDPTDCIWEETVWLNRSGDDTVIPHHVARFLLAR